ncbi:hypothetical protein [Clostridium sp. YIM B02555]|uniref:hypothetical protein n=1 Tax=Clostridium sp. YIM B02555 TaxID=2911968 RepID=UPI001EEDEE56|nr:hypothetical protein [Clostridium sp. YIM B02555]
MNSDVKLELSFATTNSYIFRGILSGKDIEVHIHIGQYHVMHINIIVSDLGIFIIKDRKFLTYLDNLMLEISMQVANLFGFLNTGYNVETYFHINFNSIRINFPPCFMIDSDEEYKRIRSNLSEIIFNKIKTFKPKEFY